MSRAVLLLAFTDLDGDGQPDFAVATIDVRWPDGTRKHVDRGLDGSAISIAMSR